ncbi:MAG: hypothetical protein QOD59_2497 [Mycobacterium sp.]|nr:hypothetical protein [Mycobacterium sp.]
MNIKRVISSIAIAGIVGASTLGIGSGIAEASPAQPNPGTTTVQPVGFHGGGGGHGGFGRGGDYGYHGGGYGNPFWHPWGWPWRW